MRPILLISFLSCFLENYKAKVFTVCELAQKLKYVGDFHSYRVSQWVCLAEHKSNFNTQAFSGENADGSRNYGIFYLSNQWCQDNQTTSRNACNMPCSKLLDDDISDDILCVKTVMEDPNASSVWDPLMSHCKRQHSSKYLASCKL